MHWIFAFWINYSNIIVHSQVPSSTFFYHINIPLGSEREREREREKKNVIQKNALFMYEFGVKILDH